MGSITLTIFQTANKRPGGGNRLETVSSLKPDCSSIHEAENSEEPKNWVFHPVGHVFKFKAQKSSKPP